jgi:hypothetical protein
VAPDAAEGGDGQLGLFEPPAAALGGFSSALLRELAESLRGVDPEDLSPRAAHDLVSELVRKLTRGP